MSIPCRGFHSTLISLLVGELLLFFYRAVFILEQRRAALGALLTWAAYRRVAKGMVYFVCALARG